MTMHDNSTDSADPEEVARGVLTEEGRALASAAPLVAGAIAEAATAMAGRNGRVIVSGVGKSGHVARKVAATLASIGQPAYFVHATEASHGDLGKLVKGDVVLAFSHSGETPELFDLIRFCQRLDLLLIGVTAEAESALARHAGIAIVYPPVDEVCVFGRAPTTSAILMMSIGDALAVCLSRLLGTTEDDFGQLHPGGSLGARLRKVADIMHKGSELPLVDHDSPMHEAMIEMSQKGLGVTLVRDAAGEAAGIITDGDLRRMGPDVWSRKAGEVANFNPQTIAGDALVGDALKKMQEKKITSLIVPDAGNRFTGLVHIHDCLRAGHEL
jgi:arabinose-5-phosphate isomerase